MVAALAAAALAAIGPILSKMFGGNDSTDFKDIFGAIKDIPQLNPNIPKYPGGGFTEPSGGGFTQGTKTTYDFSGLNPKQLNKLLSGKHGKDMSQDFRDALKGGGRSFTKEQLIQWNKNGLLPGFLSGKNKIKSIGKPKDVPFSDPVASPKSEGLFNLGSDFELINALNNIKNISAINNTLLPSLRGLNLNAFNSANDIVSGGLTSLSGDVENRIQGAKDAFVQGANIDLTRSFNDATRGTVQEMANLGYEGENSGGRNVFNRSGRNLTDAQTKIALGGQQYAEQLRQDELNNRRAAFSTMASVPAFGSGLSTLLSPGLPMDKSYQNPTGQFDFGTLLNQLNQQNQFSLQSSQLKMQPYLAALPGAIGAALQPGFAGSIGSSLGSIAPWLLLGGGNNNINIPGASWLSNIIGKVAGGVKNSFSTNFGAGPQGSPIGII